MSIFVTTFLQSVNRLLGTISIDIPQYSLVFLSQWRGRQYVAYSCTETETTSLFSMVLCESLGLEQKETVTGIEFITLKAVSNDNTLHKPHSRQSWYFKQISSLKGGEADIFPSLKWSYHSGCRLAGKPDSYSLLRHRVASLCLLLLTIDRRDSRDTLLFFSL